MSRRRRELGVQFKLKITNGAKLYNSELQVLDALPFGTPVGTTIDFTPPAGWNCGGVLPNIYACSSGNPNLAPGASVEIPMTVKVPVGPATPCTVNNNAQIIKAPPGTLLNIFNNDDFDTASAQFQTVVKPDGTFICAWPAMGGGSRRWQPRRRRSLRTSRTSPSSIARRVGPRLRSPESVARTERPGTASAAGVARRRPSLSLSPRPSPSRKADTPAGGSRAAVLG